MYLSYHKVHPKDGCICLSHPSLSYPSLAHYLLIRSWIHIGVWLLMWEYRGPPCRHLCWLLVNAIAQSLIIHHPLFYSLYSLRLGLCGWFVLADAFICQRPYFSFVKAALSDWRWQDRDTSPCYNRFQELSTWSHRRKSVLSKGKMRRIPPLFPCSDAKCCPLGLDYWLMWVHFAGLPCFEGNHACCCDKESYWHGSLYT